MAEGGKGGIGNLKSKSMYECTKGEKPEYTKYQLTLKMMADVGFIGFPNAGKSTLLASVSC